MNQFDKLIRQLLLTLNLLRQSNITTAISVYSYQHGPFDYNKMPLALLGCEVLAHNKPHKRGSWSEHASKGCYVSTSPEHYGCQIVVMNDKKQERVSDSLFQHKYIPQPEVTTYNRIMAAMNDLAVAVHEKGKKENKVCENCRSWTWH